MRKRHLNRLLIAAILLTSTAPPLHAQRQQQNVTKLRADAQLIFSTIGSDKAKMQAYCEIAVLGGQIVEATQDKDEEKAHALMQRIDALERILGPEYPILLNRLYEADPDSKDVQDIMSMFEMLAWPTKCGQRIAVACWANDRGPRRREVQESL